VVDSAGRLEGVVTRVDLTQVSERAATGQPTNVHEVVHRKPAVAFPDEPLRAIVHRMAMSGLTRFPVVERGADRRLVGVISLEDLLKARVHNLEAEHRRERILRVRIAFPFGLERTKV
jgi:CBS domain-containing protein